MERAELIRYLHIVLDLENAAQFCRETESGLDKRIKHAEWQLSSLYVKPLNLSQTVMPVMPIEPKMRNPLTNFFSFGEGFFASLWIGFTAFTIFFKLANSLFMGLVSGVLLFLCAKYLFAIRSTYEEFQRQKSHYEQFDLASYEIQLKNYQSIMEQHQQQQAVFDDALTTCKMMRERIGDKIAKFESQKSQVSISRSEIERKLRHLYEKNIIYSKYRNLVALSYIADYLESGIADELSGPNGAYAQYENDARTQKICNSIEELKEIVESGFSNVLHAQSQIYQALVEIRGGVYQIQRSVDNVYSALGQAASTLGTLLKNEQEFSERTSQQLAQIRQAAEVTAKDTSMIAFNQYIDAKMRGVDAYYTLNM